MRTRVLAICLLSSFAEAWGQGAADAANKPRLENAPELERLSSTKVPTEVAGIFQDPIKCDSSGNLYFYAYSEEGHPIKKLDPKGHRLAIFSQGYIPDVHVNTRRYFSIRGDDTLDDLIYSSDTADHYVATFAADGSFRSKTKLAPPFNMMPAQVAAFSSGSFLVSGTRSDYDANHKKIGDLPFTGAFSADGTLLREIKLADDDEIEKRAAGTSDGSAPDPHALRAVTFGQMEAARDGNVYLLRRVSPAIIYAISAGGEAVKRFTVDPDGSGFSPASMNISGGEIALQFVEAGGAGQVLVVVDLDGHRLRSYQTTTDIGVALACYSSADRTFLFLRSGKDGFLQLDRVGTR